MGELTLTINGRNYGISCDHGQEDRVLELGRYVDKRLREMASAGAASNESHLLVLTSILLADEIFDLRAALNDIGGQATSQGTLHAQELAIADTIDQLAERIGNLAERLQKI